MKAASENFGKYAKENLIIQVLGAIFCSTILDTGYTFGVWLFSCVGYWFGFIFIRVRRPAKPSKIDLLFIRFATLIIFGVTWAISPLVYYLIGDLL